MMKNRKKKLALLLSGMFILNLGLNVYAASGENQVPTVGTGTEVTAPNVSITKTLEMADGITPPSAEFEFIITALNGAPEIDNVKIPYNKDTENSKNIIFNPFPHAGVYEYIVEEKPDTYQISQTNSNGEKMEYSKDRYQLRVYVANGETDGKLFIKSVTAEKKSSAEGTGTKVDKINFTNTYRKNTSLSIEKQTTGTFADKTKPFAFEITLYKASTTTESTVNGSVNGIDTKFTYETPVKVELADNQKVIFNSIPAGTTYIVKEIAAEDGYTPSAIVIENGISKQEIKATEEKAELSTGTLLAGENENKVVFTNSYKDVPITGVVMNNLPFVMLIVVAVVALSAFILIKIRKRG